jgi:hypothetical protein
LLAKQVAEVLSAFSRVLADEKVPGVTYLRSNTCLALRLPFNAASKCSLGVDNPGGTLQQSKQRPRTSLLYPRIWLP